MDKHKLEQQKLLRQMTEELHSKLYPKKQQNTFLLNISEYPRTLCSHHLHITRWHAQVQKEKKNKKTLEEGTLMKKERANWAILTATYISVLHSQD